MSYIRETDLGINHSTSMVKLSSILLTLRNTSHQMRWQIESSSSPLPPATAGAVPDAEEKDKPHNGPS